MRNEIITKINKLSLGAFKITSELPYSNSGTELYLKNVRTIYVDNEITKTDTAIPVLNGHDIFNVIKTVRVLFVCDAKNIPSNYDAMVTSIKQIRNTITGDYYRREAQVDVSYVNDLMQTAIDFNFYAISEEQ